MGCGNQNCGKDHCGTCCGGSCGGCGGCGGALLLTAGEIDLLLRFAQLPFLPAARRQDQDAPVCLEDGPEAAEELSRLLAALEGKGLIRVDYDLPLTNFDYAGYEAYPIHGSAALTAAGQQAVELLEIQGIGE